MSVEAMVWANRQRTGSPTTKLLLLLLCDRSNADNIARFVPEELAEQAEVTTGAVLAAIEQLVEIGLASLLASRDGQYRLGLHLDAGPR